jgi:SPP1 family predicted phage head-tail adaptor
VRAGRLRHRVTIQAPADGADDRYGQPAETFSDWKTEWMSVEPLSGREFFEGRAQLGEEAVRFRGRYRSGVTNRYRLVFNDVTYAIVSVINIGERNVEVEYIGTRLKNA